MGIFLMVAGLPMIVGAQDSSLLWEISGNKLEQPSYIYGTIHMMCGNYQLPDKVQHAITKSEQIYMELDMDDPQLPVQMQQLAINKNMSNLSSELSDNDQQKLNSFLTTNYHVGLDQLGILKPIALMGMILMKRIDCETVESIEELVQNQASTEQKEIHGLETVAFQMGLFDKIPLKDQINWIMDLLEEKYSQEYDQMMQAYQTENLDQLRKLITESPGMDGYMDLLLNNRNANWIQQISKVSATKSTFYAVGAGHLTGSKGVIALLRREGYKLKPVK